MVWNPGLKDGPLLYNLNLIATSISLVCSLAMCYLCFKTSPKNTALKLILAIAISDFVYTISNFMSAFEDEKRDLLCIADAVIREFTYTQSVFWVTCTAILCCKASKTHNFNQEAFFKKALVIGLAISTIITLLPLFFKNIVYGNGLLFCYMTYAPEVTDWDTKLLILMVVEDIPIIIGLIITLGGYILSIRNFKILSKEFMNGMHICPSRLLWYPAILFLTFSPCLIDNLIQSYQDVETPTGFEIAHLLLTHSIGFNNAILYGMQRRWYQTKQNSSYNSTNAMDNNKQNHESSDSLMHDLVEAGFEDF